MTWKCDCCDKEFDTKKETIEHEKTCKENEVIDFTNGFSIKGVSEELTVYMDKVSLTPKGAMGFMLKGLKGTKTLYYKNMTGLQFKKSGSILSGYLQFSLPGGNEGSKGIWEATKDENTFMFAGNNDIMKEIKEFIESRILDKEKPINNSKSLSEELIALKKLKDEGIINTSQFEKAKNKLIK